MPAYKVVGTLVYLRGILGFSADVAANNTLAVLPVGARPPAGIMVPGVYNGNFCRLDVQSSGGFVAQVNATSGSFLSLGSFVFGTT